MRLGVDADGTADGGRICAKARLPEGMREHDGVCIAIGEDAADQRAAAEGREKRRGDPGGADLLGRPGERQGGRAGRDQGGIFDGRRLDAAVEIVRDGDLGMVAVLPGIPHEHQPLGLAVGQRPEQDAVEHREDGSVRPGGDSERQDRGDRKGGPVAKGAKRVAQVVHARLDGLPVARVGMVSLFQRQPPLKAHMRSGVHEIGTCAFFYKIPPDLISLL